MLILSSISLLIYLITQISEDNIEKISVLATIATTAFEIITVACGIPLIKYGIKIFRPNVKDTIKRQYRNKYREEENFNPLYL